MGTTINHLLAVEHIADLHRAAERRRVISTPPPVRHTATIQLRLGTATDRDVVRRLAELDDAPALAEPVLLAFSDGEPVAGLSLRDRRVVANPFVPTSDAVALLRLRAEHLSGGRTDCPRRRRKLRVRFA
jgi:hypothetical protein